MGAPRSARAEYRGDEAIEFLDVRHRLLSQRRMLAAGGTQL
jgi:hypothetical protein